jgi:hypothetical protein
MSYRVTEPTATLYIHHERPDHCIAAGGFQHFAAKLACRQMPPRHVSDNRSHQRHRNAGRPVVPIRRSCSARKRAAVAARLPASVAINGVVIEEAT